MAADTDRLTPEYEAEIRERIVQLDSDRTFPAATWLASSVNSKSVFPPEQSHVVEDVLQTASFVTRASVGVFGDKRHAEFTAHARDDIPALLAELDHTRAEVSERDQTLDLHEREFERLARRIEELTAERDRLRDEKPVDLTPIPLRWDRLVIHPNGSEDDSTIVCCLTDDGRPAALFLDDELREALGMQLVDPNPDGA